MIPLSSYQSSEANNEGRGTFLNHLKTQNYFVSGNPARVKFTIKKIQKKSHFCQFQPMRVRMQEKIGKKLIEKPYPEEIVHCSMEELQLVVLGTDELESQEEPHAKASFGILSQPSFRAEQKELMFLI